MQVPGLYILRSERGRGVYTATALTKGDIVEIAPVLVLPAHEKGIIHRTTLHDYYFDWQSSGDSLAIALGYGSLYNHSASPNLTFEPDYLEKAIRFTATVDIDPGTELTIDYHAGLEQGQLWFTPI